MSKNCPEGLKTQFSDIFWTIFAYLVDGKNASNILDGGNSASVIGF